MIKLISNFYNRLIYKFKKYDPFMISTMGRSGTWYNREFFYFYSKLLNGEKSEKIIDDMIKNKTKIKYLIDLNKKKFRFDSVFIQHFLCPGFEKNYHGDFRKEWDKLIFYSTHIPAKYTKIMIDKNIDKKVNPYLNPKSKVIYYLRNPLDQCVAYYRAIQSNKDQNLNFYFDTNLNKKKKFIDIHNYLRNGGIDMYLKHYLSFKLSKEKFPNNILILYYEDMVNKPEENFSKVLKFIGHEKNTDLFNEAIRLSSKDSIIKLENAYGESISKAFKDKSDRQLIDAKIGKWKNQLVKDDINYVEERFKKFDINLKTFTCQ